MKIILLADVPKIGNRYDIKDLKDGFAQNVLIAKGLAILATPKTLANLESKKNEVNKKKEEEIKTFSSLISSVNNKTIIIKAKANEKGHLFKSVNAQDIKEAIKKETNIEIEEKSIVTSDHIKEIGNYKIKIKKGKEEGICEIEVRAI